MTGAFADRRVADSPIMSPNYGCLPIGSGAQGGFDACEFINRVPVALFSVCLAGLAKNETALTSARDTIYGSVRAIVTPAAEVLFAGKIDRRGVALGLPSWLARFFPTMDFRDWNKIRSWAQTVFVSEDTSGGGNRG